MEPTEVRETNVRTGTGTAVTEAPVVETAPLVTTSRTTTAGPVGYRATALVWLVIGVMDVILAFDFLFRALKANDLGFANFIYTVGGALAAPFDGIFGVTAITNNSMVVRWADLLAIAVYGLVGMAISTVVRIASTRDRAVV